MNINTKIIKIYNKEFNINSGDNYVKTTGDLFEPQMTYLFETLINKDMTVVDVGANVGLTTLCFSQLAKFVYAFEPSKTSFGYLQQNIKVAEASNIIINNTGLASSDKYIGLTYSPTDRTGASLSSEASHTTGHVVENVQLINGDEYFNEIKVDFIKIDVEGYEQEVIRGMSNTLSRCKPVTVLEMNHFCLNVLHRTPLPDFVDFLLGKFPILLGIHSNAFIDLRDDRLRYRAMYDHVNRGMYYNLVGMYTIDQSLSLLKRFAQIKP